jgi:hypothetical protein
LSTEPDQFPRVLRLYLELTRYPILASHIRERMRQELFARGVIAREAFEAEVHQKAVESQQREGLDDPLTQEPPDQWNARLDITREHLTDFYFAYNLPHDLLENLVRQVLADRIPAQDVVLTFHPELAPWDMLFAQGEAYEALPPGERPRVAHHLQEIKVVLIKAMISDHLRYVGLAKEWFDRSDLKARRARRFGRGKIGGKAAGMMLAERILHKSAGPELRQRLCLPASWFVGADVFRQFTQLNDLLRFADQKYKSEREIRADYPVIREKALGGRFPEEVTAGLRSILEQVGPAPLIVRSSSLLEDNFGTAFAGKYESHFCPNQGSPDDNLRKLLMAISRVYASVYGPDVLLYRRRMGLVDYDERMAILIQEVQGRRDGRYFLPDAAGVAFSRNQFRWHPRIDRRAGFLRLVWGMGTRAVEQLAGDYPRLVALSHPDLRPESDPRRIRHYSQQQVDLIDIETNTFRSMPVAEVLRADTPNLRLLAQRAQDGTLQDIVSLPLALDPRELVLTFDGLLRRTSAPGMMRRMLQALEAAYAGPVDTEFVLQLDESGGPPTICLLQCRPQSQLDGEEVQLPTDIPAERRLFISRRIVPDGRVSGIRTIVYVSPAAYSELPSRTLKVELARLIGRLNQRLAGETFILIGPGRWGSDNPDLGIPVGYGDIFNARALIEMAADESSPEPSYGTHFFQDLLEAHIYPLALAPGDPGAEFNRSFFEQSANVLATLLPDDARWDATVHVIDVPAVADGASVELVMDGDAGESMAYLTMI